MKFIVIGLLIVVILLSFTEPIEGKKKNYKKDIANNREYVGNDPDKYPHLHFGDDFAVYSEGRRSHKYLQNNRQEVNNLLKNKKYKKSAKEPDEITKALKKMKTY